MARDPLAYTYIGPSNPDGTAAEFMPGIPSRDVHRAEFDGLNDAEKVALDESPLHRAYGKAHDDATEAAERVLDPGLPSDVQPGTIDDPDAAQRAADDGTLVPIAGAAQGTARSSKGKAPS